MSYCEANAVGQGTPVFTAGPAGFFGLSLSRGSNLRYSDCFLNADSLNCKKKPNTHTQKRKIFRTCNYIPAI